MNFVFRVMICALVVCFALTGCSTIPDNTVTTTGATQQDFLLVDGFSDYHEYLNFLETWELPDHFIPASKFLHFGEFACFVLVGDSATKHMFTEYLYTYTDVNNLHIFIGIDHETPSLPGGFTARALDDRRMNLSDMRTLTGPDSGHYTIYGITYEYLYGNLFNIILENDGVNYVISADQLCDYPLDPATPLAQLLNIQNKTEDELYAIFTGE